MALVRFYRDKNGKPGFKVRPGFCLNANYDGRKSLFSAILDQAIAIIGTISRRDSIKGKK
jgi:hypothetical protein